MQLSPQAFPFRQTLQHAPLGSTDHSMLASPPELAAGLASPSLEPLLVKHSVTSAASANDRTAILIRAR